MIMDPNKVLHELRGAIETAEDDGDYVRAYHIRDIANAFEDLDKWLKGGGALPSEWEKRK